MQSIFFISLKYTFTNIILQKGSRVQQKGFLELKSPAPLTSYYTLHCKICLVIKMAIEMSASGSK